MAVEARHLNLFSPQFLIKREIMNPVEANTDIYSGAQVGRGLPLSVTTTTTTDTLLPVPTSVITDSIPQKTPIPIKSESGISYNLPVSRKRPRESLNPLLSHPSLQSIKTCASFSFLGEDFSLQIQQQQLEIEHFIFQHMGKVRMELEEKRKSQATRIIEVIEESMAKRLREKDDEIEKFGKLNWALEERVKSLCIENQIWRDLAQTNEATANALRSNLEQVLATQVKEERSRGAGLEDSDEMDDAQSSCGSSGGEREGWSERFDMGPSRLCRNCRKEESRVLLLPCRHLCLCTVCGSSLHTCPVCQATKNASVHVNMS